MIYNGALPQTLLKGLRPLRIPLSEKAPHRHGTGTGLCGD